MLPQVGPSVTDRSSAEPVTRPPAQAHVEGGVMPARESESAERLKRSAKGSEAIAPREAVTGLCDCPCHRSAGGVVHPVPCCEPCPRCRARIARGALQEHLATCKRGAKQRHEKA